MPWRGHTATGPAADQHRAGEGGRRPVSKKNCDSLSRKAKKKSQQAKKLRRQAAKASSAKQEGKLRNRADRLATEAGDLNQRASTCRSSSGGRQMRGAISISKESIRMRLPLSAVAALAISVIMVAPAAGAPEFTEFSVNTSDSQAGAHPDLNVRFQLEDETSEEVVRDLQFNLPEGVFGNPGAIFRCEAADFATNHCQPGSQAGIVTIVSTYEGTPGTMLGTAGDSTSKRSMRKKPPGWRSLPPVNVPIGIPISVRSRSDYGLVMKATSISQTVALSAANFVIWGFPANGEHDVDRFHPGGPANRRVAQGLSSTACIASPYPQAGRLPEPFTDNPSLCTGSELPVSVEAVGSRIPTTSPGNRLLPRNDRVRKPAVRPGLQPRADDARGRWPRGWT